MKIQVRNRTIYLNGKWMPLISGEVHYWRLDPLQWKKILEKVRELGLEIVSTYIPWEFHEIASRVYDFEGRTDPRRNLAGYLELLEEMGFRVILRPGPYIYSEWKNLGIPERVVRYHRTHPVLVEEATHYLRAVFKVIEPHFATRGGCVILLQPDNELDPFLYCYEDKLGLAGSSGPFQEYLQRKYRRVHAINLAWGTRYKKFEEARPFASPLPNMAMRPEGFKRYLDFKEFIYDWVSQMGKLWCKTFREFARDIPLFLNLYAYYDIQPWKALARAGDFSALDIYPSQEFRAQPDEHRDFLEKMRSLRVSSPVPFIAEFQSGTWHGYHTQSGCLSPNHYRMSAVSALLAGATGWNWYMLVNRDNWYLSPIDEWGEARPELFEVFKSVVRVFQEVEPHKLQHLTSIGVSFFALHHAAKAVSQDDPLLKSLYETDIDYEFVDMSDEVRRPKLVFYSGASWLPRQQQNNLLRFVEKGGILVSFLQYPCLDEDLKPLNLLGWENPFSVLGEETGIGLGKVLELCLGKGGQRVEIKSPFYLFKNPSETSIQAVTKRVGGIMGQWNALGERAYTIGYCQKRGEGRLVCIGTNPTPFLLRELLKFLKVQSLSSSKTAEVQTALYRHPEKGFFLFAVNSGCEEKSIPIQFSGVHPRSKYALDLFSGEKLPTFLFEDKLHVVVRLAPKNGTVVHIS